MGDTMARSLGTSGAQGMRPFGTSGAATTLRPQAAQQSSNYSRAALGLDESDEQEDVEDTMARSLGTSGAQGMRAFGTSDAATTLRPQAAQQSSNYSKAALGLDESDQQEDVEDTMARSL